jgi:ABC-type glycerol-3-phosphate transport system permease component
MMLMLFSGSLKGKTELMSTGIWTPPKAPVWKNYVDAWNIGRIGTYTLNSAYVTILTMFLTILLGSMAAYVLGRIPFKGSGMIMTIILIGMYLPPFVVVIPLFNIMEKLGMLNNLTGLTIIYVAKQLPFTTYVLTSFYKGLPYELEEAAIVDGAGPVTIFAKIMMPLTGPAMLSVSINNLLQVWNEFLMALIFIGDKNKYTLPIGLWNLSQTAEYSSGWSILFAGMIISVIPVLIIFAIFQREFTQGVTQGAVKG